jgi:hypothetical protein
MMRPYRKNLKSINLDQPQARLQADQISTIMLTISRKQMEDQEKIILLIAQSFATTSPPAPDNIVGPGCKGILEAQEIEAAFQNQQWQSITNEMLAANRAALGYFSNEAFMHFLPAFMRLIVEDIEAADVATEMLLDQLSLPTELDARNALAHYRAGNFEIYGLEEFYHTEIENVDLRKQQFLQKVALVSAAQSHCILQFLQHLQAHFSGYFEDGKLLNAIERHWLQFADL